jgi:hypothetical protein
MKEEGTMTRTSVFIAAGCAMMLAACSSPEVDLTSHIGRPWPEAAAAIEEAGLTYEATPDIDPASASAGAWTASSFIPAAGLHEGDEVSVILLSVLYTAAEECGVPEPEDLGTTLVADMAGNDLGSGELAFADIQCLLEATGAPASVEAKMGETRALDGRQEDSWGDIEVSWSYHPDQGLDVIFELR